MKALYFNEFGNSSVLKYGQVADPKSTNHDLLVQTAFIGLNFADIYRRRGDYQIKSMPHILMDTKRRGQLLRLVMPLKIGRLVSGFCSLTSLWRTLS